MAAGEGSGAAGVIVDQGGRPLELQAHNTAQKPPLPWIYISCHPCTVQYSNLANIPTATASYAKTKTPTLEANIGYTTNQPAEIHEWHETGVGTRDNISCGLYTYMKAQPFPHGAPWQQY